MTHTPHTKALLAASTKAAILDGRIPASPSAATKRKQSIAQTTRLTSGGNVYSSCKHGRRDDIGDMHFRSSWEANYARYLNLLIRQKIITAWEYEAETFWFEAIRRGTRSYTPDFRITEPSGSIYFVEVKGWMDAKSKTKLKRMKKYYPAVEIRVVDQKAYREISRKLGGAIPGWESRA